MAVLPTLSAIPLYYANAAQLSDNTAIQIIPIHAGIDGEELLQKEKADIILSDEVRAIYHRGQGKKWKLIGCTTEEAGIVTSQQVRLRKLSQLEERTLAVPRFCALDLLREQAQLTIKQPYDRVLPTQINNLYLRTHMLNEGQVEAAVLPEPFLSIAKEKGHIEVTPKEHQRFTTAWITTEKALSQKPTEIADFVAAYNAAVEQINKERNGTLLASIAERLEITGAGRERIKTYRYTPIVYPQEKSLQMAADYLNRRAGQKKYNSAHLVTPSRLR